MILLRLLREPSLRISEVSFFIKLHDENLLSVRLPIQERVGAVISSKKSYFTTLGIKLFFAGRILKNEDCLYDLGLMEGSTVFAFIPISGGGRPKKVVLTEDKEKSSCSGKKEDKSGKKKDEDLMEEEDFPENLTEDKGKSNYSGRKEDKSGKKKDKDAIEEEDFSSVNELNLLKDFEEDIIQIETARKRIKSSELYQMYVDGASKSNPGPAGVGYLIQDMNHNEMYSVSTSVQDCTNNVAEYTALIYGLKTASDIGIRKLKIFSDAELIVKQIKGIYKVNDILKPYFEQANLLMKAFDSAEVIWISRENNKKADSLAKKGIKVKIDKDSMGVEENLE